MKGIRFALTLLTLVVSVPGGARAAPASTLGPETTQAQPSGGYIGKIDVAPKHAAAGDRVTIRGQGFPPGAELALVWRTVNGRWNVANGEYNGREYVPVGYRFADVVPDGSGRFVASLDVPEDFGFLHDIVVQSGTRLLTQTAFHVDMTVSITPESGPVGTPIMVEVKGIGWRQLENSWLLSYDNTFTGWVSAVQTNGTARFTIPATGGLGMHVLRLIHGEFTFPYLNPQQNPVPDRPRFAVHFNVTPGPAVLPAAPAAQVQKAVHGLPEEGDLVAAPRFSQIGDPVEVIGTSLTAGKRYRLNWTTKTGNRVAQGGWEESSKDIAEAIADETGRALFRFRVPDDLGGEHGLWIQDGAVRKTGRLWVTPSALPLDVDRGPAGTMFTVHLKGVGWTETANIFHVVYDNAYAGYACGFNSQGDVMIFLPATGEPGWHYVDLYPGIYKGREVRPNNFRIPQLTYAEDHPGEDLPAFHFAIEVTGRGTVGR